MCMYNETKFKIEFELQARQFWNQWDEFDEAIKNCSPRLEKANAMAFAKRYGGLNYTQIAQVTDANVSSFLHNEAFSGFTIQQIKWMCHPTTDNIEEEMNLLQKREDVERALMEYQRSYLSSEIFHKNKVAMSALPSTTIQVIKTKHNSMYWPV